MSSGHATLQDSILTFAKTEEGRKPLSDNLSPFFPVLEYYWSLHLEGKDILLKSQRYGENSE
jgi:hypothetical protein